MFFNIMIDEKLRTQEVLDLEERRGEKRGKKEWQEEFSPGTGPARKILGMEIVRDRGSRTLKVEGLSIDRLRCGNNEYLTNPCKTYNEAVKWILKYLKGTTDVGLVYGRNQGKHVDVDSFVDADYAKDLDKGRSGVYGAYESCWLKGLLIELGKKPKIVESRNIEMAKIGMKDNAADAFTKMAPRPKFKYCIKILDVRQVIRLLCLGNFELESALDTHKKYLDFSDSFAYNNPSPHFDPMFLLHSTLTPFDESDFLLFEEADAFIAIDDEPVSPVFNATYYDPEGDILILEALLNSRVTFTLPNKVIYFPENQRRSQIH
ncbi:hypothetical protein Tco_0795037 [Tanacetum coccineum]